MSKRKQVLSVSFIAAIVCFVIGNYILISIFQNSNSANTSSTTDYKGSVLSTETENNSSIKPVNFKKEEIIKPIAPIENDVTTTQTPTPENLTLPEEPENIMFSNPVLGTVFKQGEDNLISWFGARAPYIVIYVIDSEGKTLGQAGSVSNPDITAVSWNASFVQKEGDIMEAVNPGKYTLKAVGYSNFFCDGYCAPESITSATEEFSKLSEIFEIKGLVTQEE